MKGHGDTNQANITGISQHAIQVLTKADRDRLAVMEAKINQPPKLLNESAGKRACCIFKVPQSLVGINQKAYRPDIVSIGPYYSDHEHLQMIQEHKCRFLGNIKTRTEALGIRLNDLYMAIKLKEEEIRKCYSQTIQLSSDNFVEMMVLDGCFIIELFRKVYELRRRDDDDPILKMDWVLTNIARDLLKLENQIPFFVLEMLVEPPLLALGENVPSIKSLTLKFFNSVVGRPMRVLRRHENLSGKHVLDLFRRSMIPHSSSTEPHPLSMIPPSLTTQSLPPSSSTQPLSRNIIPPQSSNQPQTEQTESENNDIVTVIPTALKLRLAGVKFTPRDRSESFMDIQFKSGELQIPNLMLDDFTTSFLHNCVAFEQCYSYCSKQVTCYATFMGCLINTPQDAEYLCHKKIIDNYCGGAEQVSCFFNNLGKDLPTDIHESYLQQLFEDVNEYCSQGLHVCWAGFVNTYFRSRWSIISVIVGFLILISTLLQAFFALFPYVDPSHHESRKRRFH